MSFNTFGKFFRFTTWGESHGPAIGCIIDGCPPLIQLKEQDIQKELDKRKPGQSKFTTQRKESDKVQILLVNLFMDRLWILIPTNPREVSELRRGTPSRTGENELASRLIRFKSV